MSTSKQRIDNIKAAIDAATASLGIHPSEVSKSLLFKTLEDNPELEKFSEWDLRAVGGLTGVVRAHYPVVTKDLAVIREQKETSKYIAELEKRLSEQELFEQKVQEQISSILRPVKVTPYVPKKMKDKAIDRHVVVGLNDTHYGLIVRPEEVSGANKFGWTEACRRTAFLAQQTIEYKIEKRDQVSKLHIILNGDIIQGVIHDLTARTAELLVHQINGAVHIIGHFITHVSAHYPEVEVHCVAGNHEDAPHRREGSRVTSHKYDSYANMIFFALSAMFRGSSHISFRMTKGLGLDVTLPAGRLLVTHGDTLFSSALGNPATTLQTKSLSDAINRFNTGEIARGNAPIKMVFMGHVHSYTDFVTFDGVRVLIAPSLSGIDSYSASLGINFNSAAQMIFESTPSHILGDSRLVHLLDADKNDSLDKIIPVFDNGLSFKKD